MTETPEHAACRSRTPAEQNAIIVAHTRAYIRRMSATVAANVTDSFRNLAEDMTRSRTVVGPLALSLVSGITVPEPDLTNFNARVTHMLATAPTWDQLRVMGGVWRGGLGQ